MRILVVGAGATGGYFGIRLAQAGRDVTFLVRPERARQLQQRGLTLIRGDDHERIDPVLRTAAELNGAYDVVLLTVKASALESAVEDIAPAVGAPTVILPFLNGMAHLDVLNARFGPNHVLGGLVRVVATLTPDGDIAQLMDLATLTLGEQSGQRTPRVGEVLALLDVEGVGAAIAEDVVASMWHKWVFIVAAGAATCIMRGPVGAIVAAPGGAQFIGEVWSQAAAVSAAAGFPVPEDEARASLRMLTQAGSSFVSSLYRDVVAGRPGEREHLLGDFTRRARTFGVATPLLDLALLHARIAASQ
ncbi:ketopantoate reductase family protein [Cellulomonas sp. 179-A 4D5 NHS]|uniref:ketopantoate reductase family protein n=1 Tax=Cellulomonas sp. 179-A 4D5 NHS TaxID=3142378 RepID=UPI0039A34C66